MKKILLSLIAIVAMASCSKNDDYTLVDDITNQGGSTVTVGILTLAPGERIIVPHSNEYMILCGLDCKVNINGGIYNNSGLYSIDYPRKHKF